MARLSIIALSVVLVQVVAALAAPNGSPADPEPALKAAAASPIAPATVAAMPTPLNDAESRLQIQHQADPKKRQANSTTAAGGMATGIFTALDGGVYQVTSESGYVVIDAKTLYPGQGALIGNEMVSEGSSGLVANGQTVMLTASSTSSSSNPGGVNSGLPASSSAASQSVVTTFVSTSTRSEMPASTISTVETVASDASTAAAAIQTAGYMVAAVGGIIGLMVL